MIREIVKIDRELCNGCGDCIPTCHEGALQMIDNKATLVSDLMCDGLGACLGHCPVDAITIEKREAQPYDEVATIKEIAKQGKNVLVAHLSHLLDHNEIDYYNQGVDYLMKNADNYDFNMKDLIKEVNGEFATNDGVKDIFDNAKAGAGCGGGCPGSREIDLSEEQVENEEVQISGKSQLKQWPVQMHLVNPMAGYFQNADLLVAADCVAFSMGDFHQKWLKGKGLAIACPKLDSNMDIYVQKLIAMIDQAQVNTITVMIMEVPCCGGLQQMVQNAASQASRKVPIKGIVVGLKGDILQEIWL